MNITRHLFLWGKPQVGKTTLIDRLLAGHPDWQVKGIRSYTDYGLAAQRATPVYIEPVHACGWYAKENALAGLRGPGGRKGNPQVFDELGVRILRDSRRADLILLDELGTMENLAMAYQKTALELLDAQTPVLGVVKRDQTPFLEAVRRHPAVSLLEITPENRERRLPEAEAMVSLAVDRFRASQNSPSCGAVVLRKRNDAWETLLIATRNGHWSFPKGHQEIGESEEDTARREILEETGVMVRIDPDFRRVLPTIEKQSSRPIICFLAHYLAGEDKPQPEEVGGLAWVPLEQAPELAAKYPQDAQVFLDALNYLMNQK